MEDKKADDTWNSILCVDLDWFLVWEKKAIKDIIGTIRKIWIIASILYNSIDKFPEFV